MTEIEGTSVVIVLLIGLILLVYGFAGGLLVAGWVLAKTQKPEGGNLQRPTSNNEMKRTARSGVRAGRADAPHQHLKHESDYCD